MKETATTSNLRSLSFWKARLQSYVVGIPLGLLFTYVGPGSAVEWVPATISALVLVVLVIDVLVELGRPNKDQPTYLPVEVSETAALTLLLTTDNTVIGLVPAALLIFGAPILQTFLLPRATPTDL